MKEKKTLTILYSHGSKNVQWKEEMETLCEKALNLSENVHTAYMELCSPTLEDIILKEGADSIEKINVLPIFLATGKHLRVDIPRIVETLSNKYSLPIEILTPIGKDDLLRNAVLAVTEEIIKN